MKRRTSLLLLFLTAWLLTVPALADVAWEPENSFYKRNERQCEPEERFYWVNGPEGYLTLREEPNGKPIANVKNGVRFYVNGTYEKGGVRWGLVNYNLNDGTDSYLAVAGDAETGWNEAWLSMEDMVLYYDQQCFREDHAGELTSEQKTFTVAGKAFCFYEYPGGPFIWQMDAADTREMEPVQTAIVYTDAAGREWGHVGYWYGNRNIWFCLSDPENPNLSVEDHTPDLYPAAEGDAGSVLPVYTEAESVPVWIIAGVVLVCGVTAYLLLRMRRKKT